MRTPVIFLLLCLLAGMDVAAAPKRKAAAQRDKRSPAAKSRGANKPAPPPASAAEESPAPDRSRKRRPAAAAGGKRSPGLGTVTYVSSGRVYLNQGRREGLAPGTELALTRRGQAAGTCRVEWVADHQATCQGEGLREGDRFTLPQSPEEPAPAPRPAPAPPTQLAEWRAALEAAPHPMVVTERKSANTRTALDVRVGHTGWVSTTARPFQQERADVRLQGLPLALGMRLYVDATALGWSRRPEGFRSPARSKAQLLVREGSVVAREPGQSLVLAVGRIWPWFVPGVAIFDGAQVGWRSQDGDFEVGGFGGGVPDPATLTPSFDRVAAGAYLAGRHAGSDEATVRLLQYETRVSYMSAPAYSTRIELEGRGRAWLGRHMDVGAWVRMGLGEAMAPGAVDAARVDVDVRPSDSWRFTGAARYDGTLALDVPPLDGLDLGSRALHGDVTASWQPAPWFSASLNGLVARDIETALARQMVGPELSFPRLFGERGGVSVGYLEELGWQKGRSAHVQTVLQPLSSLRLLGRASYFEDTPIPEAAVGLPGREVGLYLSTELSPAGWLAVRLAVLGRFSLNTPAEEASRPAGLVGQASLGGTF